jgi:FAD/FMN-containing dehydrogenase
VHVTTSAYDGLDDYLQAMRLATENAENDFVEGLFFSRDQYYLMVSRFVEDVPHADDILRREIFYKLVQRRPDVYLTTKDYIFRYDPEWFWNIPESTPYRIFRKYAPRRLRNSAFYTRYCQWEHAWERFLPWQRKNDKEPLIQDWEVPWENARELVKYALENVDLGGKPWVAVPIKTPASPTLYPIRANQLYFNLGCYCQVKKVAGREDYHYTKIMDRRCFELGGIKMLYSSSFLSRNEFERLYNGAAYAQLKTKYDPQGKAYTLYEKTVTSVSRE